MRELRNIVPPGERLRQRVKQHPRATAALIAVILVLALIDVGHDAVWTGFGDKTLWDWLQLLVVPTVLAVGGFLFTRSERRNDLEIASQHTQDAALQAYIDQMTMLLMEHGLHSSAPGDDVRAVARARTLTTLQGLDGGRKANLLQFLYESDLITKGRSVVSLSGADLSDAKLFRPTIGLRRFKLHLADLRGADLVGADLRLAELVGCDLTGADLTEAEMRGVHLEGAILCDATLLGANLTGAWLNGADLRGANLRRTYLIAANLEGANLAELPGRSLGETAVLHANLERAKLNNANLENALFGGSVLDKVDLTGTNVTQDQLDKCRSFTEATMPDGSKHD